MLSFAEQGYLELPAYFDAALLERYTDELLSWPEVPGQHMVYYETTSEGARRVTRIENFEPYHPGLAELLERARETVGELFGEPAVLFKDKINFKPPGGAGFDWHQDVQAGWERYGSLHISVMLPIDRCTPENGCLEVAPGRHREGMLGPSWEPLSDATVATLERVPLLTGAGDAVLFDSFLPHGSGPNRTDQGRRVLYATYGRASEGDQRARYFADKRRAYPPDIERDPGREYRFRV